MEEWKRVIINQLLLEKKISEGQVRSLEVEVNDLQGQRSCLLNKINRLKVKYKAVRGKMKLNKDKKNGGLAVDLFLVLCSVCCWSWQCTLL
ncbi:Basic leucine zipper 10 [Bienertia sinuspersici]